jgi:hypothetical protein
MPTAPHETDAGTAEKRRVVWIALAALLLPATLILIGNTSRPEWGFIVIALVFPALWIAGRVRNRRTREGSDERASEMHRRAAAFSWQVTAIALVATMAWNQLRYGLHATQPYLSVAVVLLVSYIAAVLWRRWRGF